MEQSPVEQKAGMIYVFIDASNLWAAQKTKSKFLDYAKTTEYIKQKFNGTSIKVFYYTAYPAEGTRKYSLDGKHKFFTFLKKGLGIFVVKKELKRINVLTERGNIVEEKGNMDVEITIDSLHHLKKYGTAVFFTGDSDFLPLITYLRKHGKRVFVFSSRNNVSEELRTGADGYTDILNVDGIWGKELKHRAELDKERGNK
ncbi:MAG: NYN domain-containing protein [Candidatus Vogelbacteria bacterium]|nr:NYN domain-containing protein [Candidatus Vogelbacteria bacterium]